MKRLVLAAVASLMLAGSVSASEDPGPPYTESQFFALAGERLSGIQDSRLEDWWAKQPSYLRQRILSHPRDYWWPIILCNYQGHTTVANGGDPLTRCEKDRYDLSQAQAGFWSADGQYIGPSEECLKRGKRDRNGVPICD